MAIPDEPLTRGEHYLAKIAGQDVTLPDEPLTRMEQYFAKIAGQDVTLPDVPQSRVEQYLDYIAENGGGGGDVTLETLNVSQNGTTNAPTGTAYNKVIASVPNTYSAGDEGKVVSDGSLVAQTAHAQVTQNGTIDTTLNNSVEVAVAAGGGGTTFLQCGGGPFAVCLADETGWDLQEVVVPSSLTSPLQISHSLGTVPVEAFFAIKNAPLSVSHSSCLAYWKHESDYDKSRGLTVSVMSAADNTNTSPSKQVLFSSKWNTYLGFKTEEILSTSVTVRASSLNYYPAGTYILGVR